MPTDGRCHTNAEDPAATIHGPFDELVRRGAASRADLITAALRQAAHPHVVASLRRLPDRRFATMEEIRAALRRLDGWTDA